jgi:hypothetical protein
MFRPFKGAIVRLHFEPVVDIQWGCGGRDLVVAVLYILRYIYYTVTTPHRLIVVYWLHVYLSVHLFKLLFSSSSYSGLISCYLLQLIPSIIVSGLASFHGQNLFLPKTKGSHQWERTHGTLRTRKENLVCCLRLYYFSACLRSCLLLKHASAEKITSVYILYFSYLVAKNCYTDKAVFVEECRG